MAFTRYDAATRTRRGHTALGGGRLALFGSVSLHTWADGLDEVVARFGDETVIDWHHGNAARLRYHRYRELADLAHASDEAPAFRRETARVVVSSTNGLRQVAHHVNGDIAAFEHFPGTPPAEGNIGESDEAPL